MMNSYKTNVIKNIICSILIVLIFACLFLGTVNLVFNLAYIKTPVRGFSMQPTINMNMTDQEAAGDTIYIDTRSTFSTNDIVIAKVSWYEHHIIKRVVGTPGDKVEIKEHEQYYGVYVNDELLYTKEIKGYSNEFGKSGSVGYFADYKAFLKNENFQQYVETDNESTYIRLGENEYFLMGDNWGHTTDSITKGPVKANEIIGRVELIVDVTDTNPFTPFLHFLKKVFSFQ